MIHARDIRMAEIAALEEQGLRTFIVSKDFVGATGVECRKTGAVFGNGFQFGGQPFGFGIADVQRHFIASTCKTRPISESWRWPMRTNVVLDEERVREAAGAAVVALEIDDDTATAAVGDQADWLARLRKVIPSTCGMDCRWESRPAG